MSENAKKGVLVTVIVLALAAVAFTFFKTASGDKPEVVKTVTMPPGFKSEKQLADEALQNKGAVPAGGAKEKDMGGPPGG